ncbi:MAG: cob(I)yrinic acid a,c-diamide adenosyltransferase [Anaerolineaceae bacterium]|nr:cob(I)yrinic acid a,c-diamide adenosyltransferase [Anaerolineaceae bacterium]
MEPTKKQNREPSRPTKGLVIVNTGNGKGKTTAAMGVLFRALGHGLKSGVIQFIKSPGRSYGEALMAQKLEVPFETTGDGFVYDPASNDSARRLAQAAWEEAKRWILSGQYDLLILDEITYTMTYGWNQAEEIVKWLKENKPGELHLILTGRNAPSILVEYADLVSEITEVKHPYNTMSLPAQKGIDY